MAHLNRGELIGNIGQDAVIRQTSGGVTVANFSVATTDRWKDGDGRRQEKTDWHNVSAYGSLAENIGQYLTKGKQVYVSGPICYREYEKGGSTHVVMSIKAEKIVLLGRAETR